MRKLSVYNFCTLNGYYKGPGEEINWHHHGEEEAAFSAENLAADSILLFGRTTYEMMAGFWPSALALGQYPTVAAGMNKAEKIVFSKTIKEPAWNNTMVIAENIIETIRQMKKQPGKNMTVLGSGSIVSQLADANLVDEYQLMFDPIVIPHGTSLFHQLKQVLHLKLAGSRVFKSGSLLLTYHPA